MTETSSSERTGGLTDLIARRWVDIAVVTLLVVVAHTPLLPVFGTIRLPIAVVAAALLGTVVATVGAARRWGPIPVLAALLTGFVAFSALGAPTTALAGAVPTPETLGAVGRGVVTSWKDIVTILPPLGAGRNMLTAPYLIALVASCVAVTLALRTRWPALALIPPLLVLAGSILMGTADVSTSIPLGLGMTAVGLVWGSWRSGRLHTNRWPGVAVLVVVGLVAGTGAGVLAPPQGRLVLREHVDPPPDLHDYPSPLAGFRQYVKDHREDTILTVDGLPDGALVRLATLDEYDGTAWMAADPETGTGQYQRIGDRIEPTLPEDGLHTVRLTVGDYANVWVPMVGKPYDLDFTGQRADELARGLYVNRATETGLSTPGLRGGDRYELLAGVPQIPNDTALEGAPLADVSQPEVAFPDVVATTGQRMAGDASTPIGRIRAVEQALQQGYFSHGLEGETPSLAGHGAARLDSLLGGDDPMVGDEEQYAAAMGLILRSLSIPARVVMGFEAPQQRGDGPVELTGDEVSAWVEVPFEGHGWVPFYPTPDEDRIWQDEETVPESIPQPQVLQPPPPAQEPPDAPPSDRQDVDIDDDDVREDDPLPLAAWIAIGAGGLLLVLLLPLLMIVLLKVRRRRRRRFSGAPAARLAGGWDEVLDVGTDLGVTVSPTATRRQAAGQLVAGLAAPATGRRRQPPPVDIAPARTQDLASSADAGTFGPGAPDESAAARFWDDVETSLGSLRTAVGRRRWWRARVSTRSLGRSRRGDRRSARRRGRG